MLDDLIKQMQEHGFVEIQRLKLAGKAKAVFDFVRILATTEPMGDEAERLELYFWLLRN